MRQKTLDGFDFEIISTLKQIESKREGDRYNWKDYCFHPRTKKPMSFTAYYNYYASYDWNFDEIVDNLTWELQNKGLKLPYEMQRRLDIHRTARPGERKTIIKPFKTQIIRQIKVAV